MPLTSTLLRGDPKLEAAAISDKDHITPGSRGPHVVKIQQALIQVNGSKIKADGIYGPITARAVANYKRTHQPPILNHAGQVDDIVGVKTLSFLDSELPRSGKLLLAFDISFTTLDMIINFRGAPSTVKKKPDDAIPFTMLSAIYKPEPSSPDGTFLRHRSNNNILLRIAYDTNGFGREGLSTMIKVMTDILRAVKLTDPTNNNFLIIGKVCVLGSSSGGRFTLDFAAEFADKVTIPHFIAPIEASFSNADTEDVPPLFGAIPPPTFNLVKIVSKPGPINQIPKRHNWFQNQGNHSKLSGHGRVYTSNMKGLEEIHGKINSFENHELTVGAIPSDVITDDDQFHENADVQGRLEAQNLIVKELT